MFFAERQPAFGLIRVRATARVQRWSSIGNSGIAAVFTYRAIGLLAASGAKGFKAVKSSTEGGRDGVALRGRSPPSPARAVTLSASGEGTDSAPCRRRGSPVSANASGQACWTAAQLPRLRGLPNMRRRRAFPLLRPASRNPGSVEATPRVLGWGGPRGVLGGGGVGPPPRPEVRLTPRGGLNTRPPDQNWRREKDRSHLRASAFRPSWTRHQPRQTVGVSASSVFVYSTWGDSSTSATLPNSTMAPSFITATS